MQMLAMDWIVTGNITCSSKLDIEGNIEMANAKKIQWVNTANTIHFRW